MPLARLKLLLAPPTWRMLSHSWRINETDVPASPTGSPAIFACLHRDILVAIRYCRPARPTLLVSKSPDGQILIKTLQRDGFGFARGSTGHDGREGFVNLLRELRAGHHVGVAVDGPKGPFGHIHDGALQLACRSGAPIIPLTVHGRPCSQLKTWDRTLVPWPGAQLMVTPGEAVIVPTAVNPEQLEALRDELAFKLGVGREVGHEDS